MTNLFQFGALAFVPLAIAAGVVSRTGTIVQTAQAADGVHCEIRVGKRSGMTTLEGVVFASAPISGSYRLSITSSGGSGGSDIDQSGTFSAGSHEPASVGVVSLGGVAGAYAADLTIKWNGGSNSCSQHIGGKH